MQLLLRVAQGVVEQRLLAGQGEDLRPRRADGEEEQQAGEDAEPRHPSLEVLEVPGEGQVAAAEVEARCARALVATQGQRERQRVGGRVLGRDGLARRPVRAPAARPAPSTSAARSSGSPGSRPSSPARSTRTTRRGPDPGAPGAERGPQLPRQRRERAPQRLGGARIGGQGAEREVELQAVGLGREDGVALALGAAQLAGEGPGELGRAEGEGPGRLAGAARDHAQAGPLLAEVDDHLGGGVRAGLGRRQRPGGAGGEEGRVGRAPAAAPRAGRCPAAPGRPGGRPAPRGGSPPRRDRSGRPRVPSGCQSQARAESSKGICPSTSNGMVCSMRRRSVKGSVTSDEDRPVPGRATTASPERQPRASMSASSAATCRPRSAPSPGATSAPPWSSTVKPR